jgi:pimeloyl-ACP methyl ester carboxylesterase
MLFSVHLAPARLALVTVVAASLLQVPSPPAWTAPRDAAPARSQTTRSAAEHAFYHPPREAIAGRHGTVIRARRLSGAAALPDASNWLVIYRSRTPAGKPVAVSGTVAVPVGTPPDGGWPVLSWAHGSTGVADLCAPSRDSATHGAHDYLGLVDQTLTRWIDHGYAVVKTDYQGLGTAGPHSYLIGKPEARAAADIVRAAHGLSDRLSDRWVVAGHSQGGQAALFTSQIGPRWIPELDLRGAVPVAPGSNYVKLFAASREAPIGGAALTSLVIRGVDTVIDLAMRRILTRRAWRMLPQTEDRCVDQLREQDSWGGLPSDQVFRDDADLTRFDRVFDANDPKHTTPAIPVLLAHGGLDTVAPAAMSEALYAEQLAKGSEIEFRYYPLADHRQVIAESFEDAVAWADARVGP